MNRLCSKRAYAIYLEVRKRRKIKMWPQKDDLENFKRMLYIELCKEIITMAPSGRLSATMQCRLRRLSLAARQQVVNHSSSSGSPLFLACRRGLAEVVDFLCDSCGADLELKGLYEVPDDHSVHFVTPLWCAAVAGKLDVVKVLVRHGADINSSSDTGSTSVRSACFMTHVDIVKYLVEQGADIHKPNFNGGTCLINSVQCAALCKFLLDNGADVNVQDIKCMTALHYAIEEHRFDTVKLLLERGADPYLKSKLNDDALRIACTKGDFEIFNHLLQVMKLTPDQIADGYELMGSTFLDEHHDIHNIHEAIQQWKLAAQIRQSENITKQVLPPIRAFGYVSEFSTAEELDAVLLDHDAIRLQSLLICQRVLGPTHKDSIFRLMFRGAAYADSLQCQKCIQLWLYALELKIRKDTILYSEVFFTAHALVKLFLDIFEELSLAEARKVILYEDAFQALKLIGDELGPCQQLLRVKPEYRRHQTNFDQTLNVLIHFIYVALQVVATPRDEEHLRAYVHSLLRLNPRTIDRELSLLHLTVMKNSIVTSSKSLALDSRQQSPFPNVEVTRLLLESGAPVNASSQDGSSPLYMASYKKHYSKAMVELLLEHGAHPDQANAMGDHAVELLRRNAPHDAPPALLFPSLKCLAARSLRYTLRHSGCQLKEGELPVELVHFVSMH